MIREALFRLAAEDFMRHGNSGGISVSELVMCPLKSRWARELPEIMLAYQYSPRLVLGRALHAGVAELVREAGLRVEGVEVPVEKTLSVDGEVYRVKGRVDLLVREPGGARVPVEVKTSSRDGPLPYEHHVLQLRVYMNMLGASRGLLFYLNPERIAEYWVNGPLDDFELAELIKGFRSQRGPRYSWECLYCPYSIVCSSKVVSRNSRG